ncbi:MAG: diadenylate cyclase CdaA [Erysipelotrichaceae bacterium]|nr:diadenylate cyclase CdaA [Erysipelotrichaceae bacterium]
MDFSLTYESIIRYIRIAVDILVVWVLINYIIKAAKASQRTIQIFQGVIFILVVQALARLVGLTTVEWITNNIVSWGFLAIIVVFQPEIRSILERLGKSNAFARISVLSATEKERLVDELVAATANLSNSKTGALITLEQSHSLNEYIKTGVPLNSLVSAELLCSIFVTSTPLHDGAVIIQGDRLACASAYFPPTNMELPSRYGARHRAAIGISEVSDAVTIVVSEESGRVGVTYNGKIFQMNEQKLRSFLTKIILNKETVTVKKKDVTAAESVSIESLIEQNSVKEEVDFKDSSSGNLKQMKTFQSTTIGQEVEEEERRIYGTQNSKPKQQANAIQQVVNDIAAEARTTVPVPVNESETAGKIKIKTVQVPKEEIHEVKEETPDSDDQPSEGGN